MKPTDRNLGMDRPISRRDLLHGMGALAGQCAGSRVCTTQPGAPRWITLERPATHRRSRGLRGSHDGSFEGRPSASRARVGSDWGNRPEPPTPTSYDHLVVVGGGISGLAARALFLEAEADGAHSDSRQPRRLRGLR